MRGEQARSVRCLVRQLPWVLMVVTGLVQAQPTAGCSSDQIRASFEDFSKTGKMPPALGRWLGDPKLQYIEPYQAFDNVWFVGVCWVSAYMIRTSEGVVLIDTVHEPHVDTWLANLRKVGVEPADVKYVLMTHGHFDHVGGAYKLKPLTGAKFVMTQRGWDEAARSSAASQNSPRPWQMMGPDMVAKDGDVIKVGDTSFTVLETPGHTFGTASYLYPVRDGANVHRAITVGGLGLNAIENSGQVESYIGSVERIEKLTVDPAAPITVHLTTHPFSNGQTEAAARNKQRQPGAPNALVDQAGFLKQLEGLRLGARDRLAQEKAAGR
ncbi:MAG: MBL fold metallo-hydrolase, partial [Burkholderiaceae bacterium]